MSRRKPTNLSSPIESTEQLFIRAWQALDDSREALVEFQHHQNSFEERQAEFARRGPLAPLNPVELKPKPRDS